MNSNQSQNQSQQQSGQDSNDTPGQQRADHARDIPSPTTEPGGERTAPGPTDTNRTPWQGQQPTSQPPGAGQDDAIRRQQQQATGSEDTDDAGDTQPNLDTGQASGNN